MPWVYCTGQPDWWSLSGTFILRDKSCVYWCAHSLVCLQKVKRNKIRSTKARHIMQTLECPPRAEASARPDVPGLHIHIKCIVLVSLNVVIDVACKKICCGRSIHHPNFCQRLETLRDSLYFSLFRSCCLGWQENCKLQLIQPYYI